MKFPTSKVDDCAVVCLFLDSDTNNLSSSAVNVKVKEQPAPMEPALMVCDKGEDPGSTGLVRSGTVRTDKGLLPESDKEKDEAKEEDVLIEDWSALEGVTRVNTLLNLPRYTPRKEG